MNCSIMLLRKQPALRLQRLFKRSFITPPLALDSFDWLCQEKIIVPKSNVVLGICKSRMGHLTEASILGKAGGTVVHTALASKVPDEAPKEDFLPLTVDYRSRAYAFGKLPVNPKKRERHGDDDEILVARFVDRAVRPLFPKGYVNDVQLTITSHAVDAVNDPTVLAVNAASFALMQSKQPWNGPIGCVRVGLVDNKFVVNPLVADMKASPLDLLYAGTLDRTVMIEAGGSQIPERIMAEAMKVAHLAVQDIVRAQQDFIKRSSSVKEAKDKGFELSEEHKTALKDRFLNEAKAMYLSMDEGKDARGQAEGIFMGKLKAFLSTDPAWASMHAVQRAMAADYLSQTAFRDIVLDANYLDIKRVDGRHSNDLRAISCKKEVLPTVHGSSYFARGDTHVLCTATLDSGENAKKLVPLDGDGEEIKQHFMLHYDFPPYCTGETGMATQLNRRMIGHGNLAEKALKHVMPSFQEFPYTVRVFSECTSSNGSSSMAAACGGTLSLLDAGVPIKDMVAGISVGLITDESYGLGQSGNGKYVLLKDIIGSEDHSGDMDFKVAGTANGITAIQLDVKLAGGVPLHMLTEALHIAREGRMEVLSTMKTAIAANPNVGLRPHAPRAELVKINEDRLEHLIGPRGETIKFLRKAFDVDIDIQEEDNSVYVFGKNKAGVKEAKQCIEDIGISLKEGAEVNATIVEILEYGLIVRVNRAGDGFIHVSELSCDEELLKKPLASFLSVGQSFKAKLSAVDVASGTLKVSRRAMLNPNLPDRLEDISVNTDDTVGRMMLHELPKFPVKPPRPWSQDFFKVGVASSTDVIKAMAPVTSSSKSMDGTKHVNFTSGHADRGDRRAGDRFGRADRSPLIKNSGRPSSPSSSQAGIKPVSDRGDSRRADAKPSTIVPRITTFTPPPAAPGRDHRPTTAKVAAPIAVVPRVAPKSVLSALGEKKFEIKAPSPLVGARLVPTRLKTFTAVEVQPQSFPKQEHVPNLIRDSEANEDVSLDDLINLFSKSDASDAVQGNQKGKANPEDQIPIESRPSHDQKGAVDMRDKEIGSASDKPAVQVAPSSSEDGSLLDAVVTEGTTLRRGARARKSKMHEHVPAEHEVAAPAADAPVDVSPSSEATPAVTVDASAESIKATTEEVVGRVHKPRQRTRKAAATDDGEVAASGTAADSIKPERRTRKPKAVAIVSEEGTAATGVKPPRARKSRAKASSDAEPPTVSPAADPLAGRDASVE